MVICMWQCLGPSLNCICILSTATPLQDETYYDAFNRKWGDLHGPVTFEPFRAAAEAFKAEVLYPLCRHAASVLVLLAFLCLWRACALLAVGPHSNSLS